MESRLTSSHLCSKLGTTDWKGKKRLLWCVQYSFVSDFEDRLWTDRGVWWESEHALVWFTSNSSVTTHTRLRWGVKSVLAPLCMQRCCWVSAAKSPCLKGDEDLYPSLGWSRAAAFPHVLCTQMWNHFKLHELSRDSGEWQTPSLLLNSLQVWGKQQKSLRPTDWNCDDSLFVVAACHSVRQSHPAADRWKREINLLSAARLDVSVLRIGSCLFLEMRSTW